MRALITPKPGRVVMIPGTDRQVPAEGMEVEMDTHWERRMHADDITAKFIEPQATAPAKAVGSVKAKGEH